MLCTGKSSKYHVDEKEDGAIPGVTISPLPFLKELIKVTVPTSSSTV